nr:MAG TPA: hypothetical protein [Caudoviricetes sp.]DAV84828.1 MAG TPA: hypothetical protein [Caudoviricetes sp.]DAZ34764.1 MAG TPA: hypothetical protein [Caudoviricetes sp.]
MNTMYLIHNISSIFKLLLYFVSTLLFVFLVKNYFIE